MSNAAMTRADRVRDSQERFQLALFVTDCLAYVGDLFDQPEPARLSARGSGARRLTTRV